MKARNDYLQNEARKNGVAINLAQEMQSRVETMVREVAANREEILTAFIAKYGFQPEECEQVTHGSSWMVIHLDKTKVTELQRAVILSRLSQKKFTFWQSVCLWMMRL